MGKKPAAAPTPPKITAAEKAELLRTIDDIKFCLDSHIVAVSQLLSGASGKVNNCIAEEIGNARTRITFWDQQRAIVDQEPTS